MKNKNILAKRIILSVITYLLYACLAWIVVECSSTILIPFISCPSNFSIDELNMMTGGNPILLFGKYCLFVVPVIEPSLLNREWITAAIIFIVIPGIIIFLLNKFVIKERSSQTA